MIDLIIRNATVVTESKVELRNLFIDNGLFVDQDANARETIDATALHAFPGVIDPHVHFNDPGRADWEGFSTGSSALAAGGGTMFFDMPLNSSPPTLDGECFDLKLAAANNASFCDFALWGGLTPKNLDKMEELADRGVVGFKAFMCDSGMADFSRADDATLLEGMRIAARLKLPVAVHAENHEIVSTLAARAQASGRTAWKDYLGSRPIVAEVEAIRRAVTFAEEARCDLHVVHVSSRAGRLAAHTEQLGARVTAETCPHYLMMTDADLETIGAAAKCSPPLRSDSERAELVAALENEWFNFVGSDHSPAPASMKRDPNAFNVWGGIAGAQSTLAAMLTLMDHKHLSLTMRLTSHNAAGRFRIPSKGRIAVDFDADLALVDLDAEYQLRQECLLDRHKLSPYVGRTFKGRIQRTILRGQTSFLDGKMVGVPRGRLVKPLRS